VVARYYKTVYADIERESGNGEAMLFKPGPLTFVHFSAQPEPFLTQNTPYTHPQHTSTTPGTS
jgi:hypothetical protein